MMNRDRRVPKRDGTGSRTRRVGLRGEVCKNKPVVRDDDYNTVIINGELIFVVETKNMFDVLDVLKDKGKLLD